MEEVGANQGGGMSQARGPGERKRIRLRRLFVLGVILIALCLFILVRLLSGPLWIGFAAEGMAARIASAFDANTRLTIGALGFSLDGRLKPTLHARDVLAVTAGRGRLSVDTLKVSIPWRMLLGGIAHEVEVEADHLLAAFEAGGGTAPDFAGLLEEDVPRSGVKSLEIGALTLLRRGGNDEKIILLDRALVSFAQEGERTGKLTISGSGRNGPWSVQALAQPGSEGEGLEVLLSSQKLDFEEIARMSGAAAPALSGPVALSARFAFAAGALRAVQGGVELGPIMRVEEEGPPILGAGTRFALDYKAEDGRVFLRPSTLYLEKGDLVIEGTAGPFSGADAPWPMAANLVFQDKTKNAARRITGALRGHYDAAERLFAIDELRAAGAGTRLTAALRVSYRGDKITAALAGAVPEIPVATLKTIWPPLLAADARRWVNESVDEGVLNDIRIDLATAGSLADLAALDMSALLMSFHFKDLAFRPFDGGPMIREAAGTAELAGGRLGFDVEKGRIDLEKEGALDLTRGRFVIPAIAKDPPDGEATLSFSGPAPALFALWQRLPAAAGTTLPAPAETRGEAKVELSLALPLIRSVKLSEIVYDATIILQKLGFKKPIEGRMVTDGALTLHIKDNLASINGTALLDGVKAEIDMRQPLFGASEGASVIGLVMSDKDRARLGLDFGSMLTGPVGVVVKKETRQDGAVFDRIEADLTNARVAVPALGLAKKKGQAGAVRFLLREKGGRKEIEDFRLDMGAAQISGRFVLDAEGRLLEADMPKISLRAGDAVALRVRQGKKGVLRFTLTGAKLDARAIIRRQLAAGGGAFLIARPIALDATLDHVTGVGAEVVTGVNLSAVLDGGSISNLSLTMQTEGGGATSMTLRPGRRGRVLQLEASEVGRLLRFLGLYRRAQGGRAVMSGMVASDGTIKASLDGSRWRIVNEPALARLATAAEKNGKSRTETVDIERLLADLTYAGGILSIDDGVIRAATAGVAMQGEIDFNRDVIRLTGSYLPASAFDSLLGRIPLLGQTVFAGGRAGLIGVTFRVSGPLDDPNLSINPLSVIAPGIFRKLFEGR